MEVMVVSPFARTEKEEREDIYGVLCSILTKK